MHLDDEKGYVKKLVIGSKNYQHTKETIKFERVIIMAGNCFFWQGIRLFYGKIDQLQYQEIFKIQYSHFS